MIGTGDIQNVKLLDEVVKAGKDCHYQKPTVNSFYYENLEFWNYRVRTDC